MTLSLLIKIAALADDLKQAARTHTRVIKTFRKKYPYVKFIRSKSPGSSIYSRAVYAPERQKEIAEQEAAKYIKEMLQPRILTYRKLGLKLSQIEGWQQYKDFLKVRHIPIRKGEIVFSKQHLNDIINRYVIELHNAGYSAKEIANAYPIIKRYVTAAVTTHEVLEQILTQKYGSIGGISGAKHAVPSLPLRNDMFSMNLRKKGIPTLEQTLRKGTDEAILFEHKIPEFSKFERLLKGVSAVPIYVKKNKIIAKPEVDKRVLKNLRSALKQMWIKRFFKIK